MAGVFREVWTGELVRRLGEKEAASFLERIPSYDQYVNPVGNEAEAIHLVDVGVEPDVLTNNTTYPIPIQEIVDGDIVMQLDKHQTTRTPVTDDELFAITYDIIGLRIEGHKNSILKRKFRRAVHALTPQENTVATPVLQATGETKADGTKALTPNDIINLKEAMDNTGVDPDDRILVLTSAHYNDLLRVDEAFAKQYKDIAKGKLNTLFYGFEVNQYNSCPYFDLTTGKKASFGVLPTDHAQASVAFHAPSMFRATGSTKMYYDEPDTANQRTLVNFRHYYVVLPKRQEAMAAIYSPKA